MKRIILAVFLTAIALPASAQYFGGLGNTQQGQKAIAKSNSSSGATAAPYQSTTFNDPGRLEYSGEYTVKNVPSMAIGGPASGPCNGFSGGAGAGWAGFGAMLNFSKVDEGCEERETARVAALMGRMDIANLVLEEMDVVKRAAERRAAKQPKPTPAKTSEAVPAQPQLVAASTMITPSDQTRAVCENARLTGDNVLANRLNCPK